MFADALIGITDLDAPTMSIAKVVLDLPVIEGHVDHDLAHTIAAQVLDDVFHHRLAQDRHHGLWGLLGERTDSGSLPRRQNHCLGHVSTYFLGLNL